MEIERKFLIPVLPENLECYSSHEIEQGYLCREPVVRIRRQDEERDDGEGRIQSSADQGSI